MLLAQGDRSAGRKVAGVGGDVYIFLFQLKEGWYPNTMHSDLSSKTPYPDAVSPEKVGSYPAVVCTGGGYVWDDVLEYRVWCYPECGAEDVEEGNDYYYSFVTYAEATTFSETNRGAQPPLALIRQTEYIDEPEFDSFIHVKKERITEWPVIFLTRPRRNEHTIPSFLSPNAPQNRLEILRGETISKTE